VRQGDGANDWGVRVKAWNVRIETQSPDDGNEFKDRYSELLVKLSSHGAAGSLDDCGWDVKITVDADSAVDALSIAHELVIGSSEASGVPMWPIVDIRVVASELEATNTDS